MPYLTFNPDSANAWVVILKEGDNTVGRAEDNDVRIQEGGVSGHHCRIVLNQGVVTITDLNSTNGTTVNGSRITNATWNPGQVIYLGNMPVRLEGTPAAAVPLAIPAPASAPSTVPTASPAAIAPGPPARLRISRSAHEPPPALVVQTAVEEEVPPPLSQAAAVTASPSSRCKFHPKNLPHWSCPKCHHLFCDLCVTTRASHSGTAHLCRACGVECAPVHAQVIEEEERGFFARLPGAFIYPFRGAGSVVLIVATIVFAALSAVSGIFSILFTMMAIGYLFLFLQNIIHCTAAGDDEMPSLPDFDGLFSAFFTLAGTIAICFVLPIGLGIAKFCDVGIPTSALIATFFGSMLYFPMAFLAVAMHDSVAAANPLVVVPAITKVPAQYLVTVILLCAVFGIRMLGDVASSAAGSATLTTRDMSVMFLTLGGRAVWSFISLYLLTVSMRFLGILYVTQRGKIAWF